ncbi:polyhydroxyalkanoate synthesis repressor PhaR [Roseospira marina]|uniref:Polyhydroxyalkanoate synthesis repressor PhaR n=1 Tax=Roseospira marina TaxID=140057 RepID=A0A5M6ID04_9PROT|nr:polyhydroxyalkanoate synthesis repressor PhaR [Roseospira marina]KAA5605847.1 polyhydroxyalkanoate synthesis repressor PhaR [Roseospira marina]MBB4313666.1 polyhydroxyalkanoate synthesis repressor PhaR [Roseospira marina]MBB5086828.1 polyhydroxyalkanoate synthesis repressor PhaR [Roseospira marina]
MTDKPAAGRGKRGGDGPVIIKKYANRRLYNTATSSYVTLDLLSQMVKEQVDFVVYDAKTGEDITRSVLTQIIVEEEGKNGQNMLPISFLRNVISFYGDSLGGVVPQYLEHSMQAFARNQEQMRQVMQNALDGLFPMQNVEELNKQNMAFFESAMKMFSPFDGPNMMPGFPGATTAPSGPAGQSGRTRAETPASTQASDDVQAMKAQMVEMQRKLDRLMADADAKDKEGAKPGTDGAESGSSASGPQKA